MSAMYLLSLDTLKLLRIPFSVFLMPIFLLALSQADSIQWAETFWAFVIIHLLVYPASNGYNSYVDRDESPIGGLEKPPMPTIHLFYLSLLLDGLAILLAYTMVKPLFALCIVLYVAASRAYSSRQIRLKKYAWPAFSIVVIIQGAFTYYCTSIAVNEAAFSLDPASALILLAVSFQIGGAYPLTQVYQHEADRKDGVNSLSMRLGYGGTFAFSAILFVCCGLCYFGYFYLSDQLLSFYLLQAFFLPIICYFGYWWYQVKKDSAAANFRNTMRMNVVSALSMTPCFLVLIVMNHFS